eukprot:3674713-Prymnesium_polylepis.1
MGVMRMGMGVCRRRRLFTARPAAYRRSRLVHRRSRLEARVHAAGPRGRTASCGVQRRRAGWRARRDAGGGWGELRHLPPRDAAALCARGAIAVFGAALRPR